MAECIKKLMDDLLFDCDDKPIAGLETDTLLINREDIDLAATTFDAADKNVITNLVLKDGATAYVAQSIKSLNNGYTRPVIEDESLNGHQNGVNIRIFKNTATAHQQIDNIVDGANLVAIVMPKQKGPDSESAFDVLGWHVGLEALADSTGKVYKENDGAYLLTLGTPNGFKEPRSLYKWLETDYATTKARFDNKLAAVGG